MAPKRDRFKGDVADLVGILRPHVEKGGKSWLRYADGKVGEGAIDKNAITKHSALIGELHAVQNNLVFKALTGNLPKHINIEISVLESSLPADFLSLIFCRR